MSAKPDGIMRSEARWSGRVALGETWAAYSGRAGDNAPHAHVAAQLVWRPRGQVAVRRADGFEVRGAVLLIRPLAQHQLLFHADVQLFYLEPETPLAAALLAAAAPGPIATLPRAISGVIRAQRASSEVLPALADVLPIDGPSTDARLRRALEELSVDPGALEIALAATRCGVSPSRLRALARRELGVPLSTWLLWRKLGRASRALTDGAGLAESALCGGFADQAHLTRTMRRMLGITPGVAQQTLR